MSKVFFCLVFFVVLVLACLPSSEFTFLDVINKDKFGYFPEELVMILFYKRTINKLN